MINLEQTMMKTLMELNIEKIAKANKNRFKSQMLEEVDELIEAKTAYELALNNEDINSKDRVKIYEEYLAEIADVTVVAHQSEDPDNTLCEYLTVDLHKAIVAEYHKHKDFIDAIILYKAKRTIFRNQFNYYIV